MGAFNSGRPLYFNSMKKILSGIIICFVALIAFNACGDKIKSTKVSIQKMTDTTFVSVIDGHHITFDIKKATFDNGFVMAGDSVEIHYIGALSDDPVKVALIKLIPKKGHVVNAVYNPNKKLETAPMSPEEQKSLDEGVDFAKKHQPKK